MDRTLHFASPRVKIPPAKPDAASPITPEPQMGQRHLAEAASGRLGIRFNGCCWETLYTFAYCGLVGKSPLNF